MTNFVKQFVREEQAADLVEYALVVGLASLGAVAILGTFKSGLSTFYGRINSALTGITLP